jgi:hypothetical protein
MEQHTLPSFHLRLQRVALKRSTNKHFESQIQGILTGGSFAVPLTSCLTGLDQPVLQKKTKTVSIQTADSKPVKQEVNGTVILPP